MAINLIQRNQIQKWYNEGRPLSEIADKYSSKFKTHISVRTIHRIIERLRERSQEREQSPKSELRADEIGKIDRLETEYWDAWFNSLKRASMHDTEKRESIDSLFSDTDKKDVDLDDIEILEDVQSQPSQSPWDKWARVEPPFPRDVYSPRYGPGHRSHNYDKRRRSKFNTPHPYMIDNDTNSNSPPQPKVTITRKIVETCGDPRYLAGVQWCIDRRAKLLGLDAPARSITAKADNATMRQMAREFAMASGMDPDLIVDEIVADAEKMLQNMYSENER